MSRGMSGDRPTHHKGKAGRPQRTATTQVTPGLHGAPMSGLGSIERTNPLVATRCSRVAPAPGQGWGQGMDMTGGEEQVGQWMTYAELAAARGIDKQSAVKLARRHGWRRQRGNEKDGVDVARVFVPGSALDAQRETVGAPRAISRPPGVISEGDLAPIAERFDAAIAVLTKELADAKSLTAVERSRADRAELAKDEAVARADVLWERIEALQAEVAEAEAAAVQARADAQEAALAAEAVRAIAEARRARGFLRRLRDAVRGE